MKHYLKLMRIHHYIKNFLVFATLICSGQLFVFEKLKSGIFAFIIFCMVSSSVYIFNDIRDKDNDSKHPTKCNRPIANGTISIRKAYALFIILLAIAIICNCIVFNIISTAILILYLILNCAYSLGLKNIPLVDISILVAGFLIRILYGAIVMDITISNWLYLTVIAFALYFALGKRRNELKQINDGRTRQVLKLYSFSFLDKNMQMSMTLANVFYALWSMDKKTICLYDNEYLIFTVPIVLLITMKYSLDVEGVSDGDPVEVLIHDKILFGLCTLYLIVMLLLLYL